MFIILWVYCCSSYVRYRSLQGLDWHLLPVNRQRRRRTLCYLAHFRHSSTDVISCQLLYRVHCLMPDLIVTCIIVSNRRKAFQACSFFRGVGPSIFPLVGVRFSDRWTVPSLSWLKICLFTNWNTRTWIGSWKRRFILRNSSEEKDG
jgi:hypothetical protein